MNFHTSSHTAFSLLFLTIISAMLQWKNSEKERIDTEQERRLLDFFALLLRIDLRLQNEKSALPAQEETVRSSVSRKLQRKKRSLKNFHSQGNKE